MRFIGFTTSAVLAGALVSGGCYSSGEHYYRAAPPPSSVGYSSASVAAAADIDDGEVDINVFYTELQPYGRWVDVPDYGRCWAPNGIAADWRPYTVGHWVYSDDGWLWVSEEPFGWAAYHYGRWTHVRGYGWVWAPGTVWGPAWVAWRHGDGFVGWAPLPPEPGFRTRVQVDVSFGERIPADRFCFVSEREIVERDVHRRIVPVTRNTTIINKTTNVTNITVVNKKVVNRGVSVERIERDTGRKIERTTVREVNDRKEVKQTEGREVDVYRPRRVREAAPERREPERREPERREPERRDQPERREQSNRPDVDRARPDDRRVATPTPPRVEPQQPRWSDAYAKDRKRVDESYANDRRDMEARQTRERVERNVKVSEKSLNQKHEAERKDLEKRHQRDMDNLHKKYPNEKD